MSENLFKLYRKRAGYSQTEAAQALHVTASAVSSWESGRYTPDPQNLKNLADLYGVTIDHLLGRSTSIEPSLNMIQPKPEVVPEDEVQIPLVASLRCGPGEAGKPLSFVKPVSIPKSFVRRWGKELQALIAVGESMSPTIIPGDMLICRPGEEWEDGNVVSANLEDTDMIKRIFRAEDGGIDLKSDNPKFNTIHVTEQELRDGRLHILGRVMISVGKEL